MLSSEKMETLSNLADFMSKGQMMTPKHLRGNPADCLAVIMQASQWEMLPWSVAQKTHDVNGIIGYEAQLCIAVINTKAPITGRLKFKWFGEWENVLGKFELKTGRGEKKYMAPAWNADDEVGLGVIAYATFVGDEETTETRLLLTQAQVRNSTLWASDPKQQLAYLAAKKWERLHCPEIMLGVYTPDEIREFDIELERDITPEKVVSSSIKKPEVEEKTFEVVADSKEEPEEEPLCAPPTVADLKHLMDNCDTLARIRAIGEVVNEHKKSFRKDELQALEKHWREGVKIIEEEMAIQAEIDNQPTNSG